MAVKHGNLSINSENIFPIIKKWLYSDHDIFVRELVSNGCDAITKLKKLEVMGEYTFPEGYKPEIQVIVNPDEKTLKFIDNGIGMTADEVEKYITQIAFSGATQFLEKYKDKTTDDQMIGHFGLGFYSAFMVADEVHIDTLSYTEGAQPVHWSCDGGTEYDIQEGNKNTIGTEITLFLNEDSLEFANEYRAREVISKYCSFMPVEIFLAKENAPQEYETIDEAELRDDDVIVERIHEELDKLWKSPFPEKLSLLLSSGLLPHIDNLLDKRLTALGETLVPQLKAAPISAPLRWTLVLQSFTEAEAKTFCKKLKFDNATAKQIQTYLRHLSQPIPQTSYEVRKLAGILGVELTENLFILQEILQDKAAVQAAREILKKVLADGDCLNLKMLEMDGKALMDAGIPAGKAVGETLGLLLEDVLHQPEHNKREYLLEKALAFQQK